MKRHLPPAVALMNCLSNVNKENENKIKLYLEERCRYIRKDQTNLGKHAGTLKVSLTHLTSAGDTKALKWSYLLK